LAGLIFVPSGEAEGIKVENSEEDKEYFHDRNVVKYRFLGVPPASRVPCGGAFRAEARSVRRRVPCGGAFRAEAHGRVEAHGRAPLQAAVALFLRIVIRIYANNGLNFVFLQKCANAPI
jgi:hypothetical protein